MKDLIELYQIKVFGMVFIAFLMSQMLSKSQYYVLAAK